MKAGGVEVMKRDQARPRAVGPASQLEQRALSTNQANVIENQARLQAAREQASNAGRLKLRSITP
jgi:hypothetical protein